MPEPLRLRAVLVDALSPTMTADYHIRLARADELELIRPLEDLAGLLYAEAGLPDDLEGLEAQTIEESQRAKLLWLLVAPDASLAGFALCQRHADSMHLRELDIHPAHARRGLGRRLIEHCLQAARDAGLSQLTLTTFRDVAWNAPLYRRYGFSDWPEAQWPPWMQAIRADEASAGLDRWPRVAMRQSTDFTG